MNRVSFQSVVDQAAKLCFGSSADLQGPDDALLRQDINDVATDYWRKMWWPEWTTAEERTFREPWNADDPYAAPTLTAAVELFYWPTRSYYQTVRDVSANTPPADEDGNVDTAHWAASQSSYTGDDWSEDAVVYTAGTITRYPANNRYYQCFEDHTSSGTLTPVATGGNARWGVLTNFVRNIALAQDWEDQTIAEVRNVWDCDPYANPIAACQSTKFDLTDRGVVVRGDWPVVWPEFRLPVPSWTGDDFQASVVYAAGEQMFWTDGDYYQARVETVAGDTPASAAAKWLRLDFPQVLARAVARAAHALWLVANGQATRGDAQNLRAEKLLADEMGLILRQQKQARTWQMTTSG